MDIAKATQPRRGSLSPSMMRRTLWSTKSPTKDTLLSDEYKANVQAVLRCRPLTEVEVAAGTPVMISCDEKKHEVAVTQYTAHRQINRTFGFDKVFGPETNQKELYNKVVSPIVNEILEGYNWTVFAYGQTGTGKTYTMEGEGGKDESGQFNKDAGIIPRAVQQIFDILEGEHADYSVKVTYLELYNEEITDLLSLDEESKRQLVLLEDGRGSVFARGLEEDIVCSADEIYEILEKGSARKHSASLLNHRSNRAHSILSITVQVKELNSVGSDLIRQGKLNLVDLAGSENILRWSARDLINGVVREAGEINKSLLTLSRVINALAENSVHVPYRDSKLTRLLRDSLGGTTKTCIIATVSPSILSQEETLCTLDIASRARSIKNRPEMNQKVTKSALLKDLCAQVDNLKRELRLRRDSNGVPRENQHSDGKTRKQLVELQELYLNQQQLIEDLKEKLDSSERELLKTQQSLIRLEDQHKHAKEVIKDKDTLISNSLCSGKALTERALELRFDLEGLASDVNSLRAQIEHKNQLEEQNRDGVQNFYIQLTQQLDELGKVVSASVTGQEQNLKVVQDEEWSFLTSKSEATDELLKQIQTLRNSYASGIKSLDSSVEQLYQNSQLGLCGLSYELAIHSSHITDLVMKCYSGVDSSNTDLKLNLNNLRSSLDTFMKLQEENQVRTYDRTKSISQSLLDFFKILRNYISRLSLSQEDSQTITNQKMEALTKKFEEFALDEEKLLVEKIHDLLASSRSRKEKLIHAAADDIIDSVYKRHAEINQEISEVQTFATDAEEKWANYIQQTDANYVKDSAALDAGKSSLGKGLQCCITESTEIAVQHRLSEECLLHALKKNVESVDSVIKDVTEDNEKINAQISSSVSSILEETENGVKNASISVQSLLKLDHQSIEKTCSLITCSIEDMREINNIHLEKMVEISKYARRSLVEDYLVDDSSDFIPRQRDLNLPSKESIQDLMNICVGNSLESSISR